MPIGTSHDAESVESGCGACGAGEVLVGVAVGGVGADGDDDVSFAGVAVVSVSGGASRPFNTVGSVHIAPHNTAPTQVVRSAVAAPRPMTKSAMAFIPKMSMMIGGAHRQTAMMAVWRTSPRGATVAAGSAKAMTMLMNAPRGQRRSRRNYTPQ